MAEAVAVAVADDANLHEGAAPDHRDGVGVVVAEVEVLHAGGAVTHKQSRSNCACMCLCSCQEPEDMSSEAGWYITACAPQRTRGGCWESAPPGG